MVLLGAFPHTTIQLLIPFVKLFPEMTEMTPSITSRLNGEANTPPLGPDLLSPPHAYSLVYEYTELRVQASLRSLKHFPAILYVGRISLQNVLSLYLYQHPSRGVFLRRCSLGRSFKQLTF